VQSNLVEDSVQRTVNSERETTDRPPEPAVRTAAQFATTHWSTVLTAGDDASPDSREALEKLCRTYWFPLYAFVRRKGYSVEDAEDLVQDFFSTFLHKGYVGRADPARGRFRTFLLTSMQNLLHNAQDRLVALKRWGRSTPALLGHRGDRGTLPGRAPGEPDAGEGL
jgi:hypothetical protein